MRVEHVVALAGDRGVAHVADREHPGAALLALAECGERIGRFPGLGDRNHQAALVDDGPAVAELAGEIDLGGNPGDLLDHVLPDQAGVVGRATGDQKDPLDLLHGFAGEVDPVEVEPPVVLAHPGPDRVANRPGLLEDLLLHEAVVAALLRRDRIPLDHPRRPLHQVTVGIGDLHAFP